MAYGIGGVNEGVVDGNNLDVRMLDAVRCTISRRLRVKQGEKTYALRKTWMRHKARPVRQSVHGILGDGLGTYNTADTPEAAAHQGSVIGNKDGQT